MSEGKKKQWDKKAVERAEIIMKVRSGLISATEGANTLKTSRKSYYKWENRGLSGMLDNLEDKESGRPELSAPSQREKELEKRIHELERGNQLLEKKMELKDLVHQYQLEEALSQSKKNDGKKKTEKMKKR
jgi:hypothetical protein